MKPRELTARWKKTVGKVAARAVEHALRAGASVGELRGYTGNLPGAAEVAPAADLRGIVLPELLSIGKCDLSGVRFDGAKMNWNFHGSALRGAVFDGAEGRNVDFGGCDCSGASFARAKLPGAVFFGAKLVDAKLPGIKMRSGQLKSADCRGADFSGGDLRLVWAADADLRGANFSGANFVGASLGGAQWDEHTRFDGAQLSVEGTPAEIRVHALAQGATIKSEKLDWELSLLDATRAALEGERHSQKRDAIIQRLRELHAEVERDPQLLWGNVLQRELDKASWIEVQHALRKAANNIGAYLG